MKGRNSCWDSGNDLAGRGPGSPVKTAKIMIVEDEIITAMSLKKSLEKQGYEVCPLITSGEDAVEKVGSEKPDIVLMDINIQGEMDGIETAKEIFSLFGIRTVFMTGYDENDLRETINPIIAAGYLIKPIDFTKLKLTIDAIVHH